MKITFVDKQGNAAHLDKSHEDAVCRALSKSCESDNKFKLPDIRSLYGLLMILVGVCLMCIAIQSAGERSQIAEQVKLVTINEEAPIPLPPELLENALLTSPESDKGSIHIDSSKYFRPEALSPELFEVVVRECEAANIPVNAALAIMKTETQNFDGSTVNYNTNGTYDSGIMQINSSNHASFAIRYNCPEFASDPHNDVANITVGVRFFAEMYNSYYETYKDEVKSLLAAAGAYNRGAGNQNKHKTIYEYNARVYAHYVNLCEGRDVNINYSKDIPEVKAWLIENISLY
jgi:hypothetical protein